MPVSLAAQDLHLPAVSLGIPDIHPEQLRREECRLLAACRRTDLHDDDPIVDRVGREELEPECLEQARLALLELAHDLVRQLMQLGFGGGLPLATRTRELLPDRSELLDVDDDGSQAGLLAAGPLHDGEVAAQARGGKFRLDFAEPALDLVEALLEAHVDVVFGSDAAARASTSAASVPRSGVGSMIGL